MPQRKSRARDESADPSPIASLVAAFKGERWDEARRLLKQHSFLIDPDIGAQVGRMVGTTESRPSPPQQPLEPDLLSESERDFIAFLGRTEVDRTEEEYRLLFERCAEVGIDAAFWEAGKSVSGGEIRRLRDEAERTHLFDDDIAELDEEQTPRALEAWRAMAAHSRFSSAPLPLQQQVLAELAMLLGQEFERTSDSAIGEERLRVCQQLVGMNDSGSDTLASDLERLGHASIALFQVTGRLTALDDAVNAYREAIDAARDADSADALWAIGGALTMRYEYSRDPSDLDAGIAAFDRAPRRSSRDPNALAIALLLRSQRTRSMRDLNRAVTLLEAHVHVSADAATFNNLATALLQRHGRRHASRDLSRGIDALRQSLARTSSRAHRAGQLANLLRALQLAPPSRKRSAEARKTIADIRELVVNDAPESVVAAFNAWGEWAVAREDWAEAASAFAASARGVEAVLLRQSSREQKVQWLQRGGASAVDAAYALARQGRLADAVLAFERGRALLLREDLLRTDPIAAVTSFDDVRRAAADAPLVLIAARAAGGMALLIGRDGRVQAIWLPALTNGALHTRIAAHLGAYARRAAAPKAWDAAIVRTTRWLWQVAMGRIADVVSDPRAVVIAAGGLGLLPLHAAWTPAARARGRRYVIDNLSISYAPSIGSLLWARRRAAAAVVDGILAVADPTTHGLARLHAANREVDAAARHFPRALVLKRRDATRERVLAALGAHAVWHFACHGFAARDMRGSGMVLANGDVLTVRQILELDDIGRHVRVAVFSACETAVIDGAAPDEAIGLPSAMLRAGAAATIGSLWSVAAGASTATLFARFYELWREDGLDPSDALQEAQRWVRDATNAEAHARFPQIVKPPRGLSTRARRTWGRARPYRAPYFWAPFVLVGA
jgi:tetratricopeptide (TPR) repeat protein